MRNLNFNKFLLVAICMLFLPLKAHALLPAGIYYGFKGGVNTVAKDNKISTSNLDIKGGNPFVAADIGIRLLDFRFEVEYAYRYNFSEYKYNNKSKDISAQNIMGNVYYNFIDLSLVKLYVNGGIGETKFSGGSIVKKNDSFTWNAGLGANVSLLNVLNLDVGYRYVDMGDLEIKNSKTKVAQKSHDIYAGLRFGF